MFVIFIKRTALAVVAAGALSACSGGAGFSAAGGRTVTTASQGGSTPQILIASGRDNAAHTAATLPVFAGTSHGRTVWYVVLDSSDRDDAQARGVNYAPRLLNAVGTAAVQDVTVTAGVIDFPATVQFGLSHNVAAGPNGFSPSVATPGAQGEPGYSPYIRLPNGIVLDAPQLKNGSGQADKVLAFDPIGRTIEFAETAAFWADQNIRYLATDASTALAAALEDATYAPALDAAPAAGVAKDGSARSEIAIFTNGQTGLQNPNHQGLSSALLDGTSPLNVINPIPGGGSDAYTPAWDAHVAVWSAAAVAQGRNTRQTDYGTITNLAAHGLVGGLNGAPFGASGFVINCPVFSILDQVRS